MSRFDQGIPCCDVYPSNIRTGPTDANASRGHRLTTPKRVHITKNKKVKSYVILVLYNNVNHYAGIKQIDVQYIILYGHTYSKSKDQPDKVANAARGQLDRENEYFPVHVRA